LACPQATAPTSASNAVFVIKFILFSIRTGVQAYLCSNCRDREAAGETGIRVYENISCIVFNISYLVKPKDSGSSSEFAADASPSAIPDRRTPTICTWDFDPIRLMGRHERLHLVVAGFGQKELLLTELRHACRSMQHASTTCSIWIGI
jgi:hypothetical protein